MPQLRNHDRVRLMIGDTRVCPVCGKEFRLRSGHQKYCSPECARKARIDYRRKYDAEHRESIRKRKREYYRKNRESELKRQREYRRKNRESIRKRRREYRRQRSDTSALCMEQHGNCFSCPYEDCIMQ